jgi:hypothetical protein
VDPDVKAVIGLRDANMPAIVRLRDANTPNQRARTPLNQRHRPSSGSTV